MARFRLPVLACVAALLVSGPSRADVAAERPRAPRGPAAVALAGATRTAHPMLTDARRQAAGGGYSDALLTPGADFDGDGVLDLVDYRIHVDETDIGYTETLTVEARRGRDAALLWRRSATGGFVYAFLAKVGAQGVNGMVFVEYAGVSEGAFVAGAGVENVVVTAVDGKGQVVWTRTLAGGGLGSIVGGAWSGIAVAGAFDALPGRATDLLVVDVSGVEADNQSVERYQIGTLSGVDGALAPQGAPVVVDNGFLDVVAAVDLNRDGLADYLTFEGSYDDATSVAATARRGTDGGSLWQKTVPDVLFADVRWVGDMSADGTADFVILGNSLDLVAAPTKSSPTKPPPGGTARTMRFFDGASGNVLWSRAGDAVYLLGDADRNRRSDVAVVTFDDAAGFEAVAYDGSGRSRWRVRRSLPTRGFNRYEMSRATGLVGDVQGDGVEELGFALSVMPYGDKGRTDYGWIDGRTGRAHRDVAPDLRPLRTPVDGSGADLVNTKVAGGTLTVTVYDGRHQRIMLKSTVALPRTVSRDSRSVISERLTADRCGDIVVSVYGDSVVYSVAIDGASGQPLWSLTRDGTADAVVSRPAVRSRTDRNSCR